MVRAHGLPERQPEPYRSLMSFNCCCSFSSFCTSTAEPFGEAPDEPSLPADTLAVRAAFAIVELFEIFVDARLRERERKQFSVSQFVAAEWGSYCPRIVFMLSVKSQRHHRSITETSEKFSVISVIHLICQADLHKRWPQ